MNKTSLTVLIPAYNEEKLIAETTLNLLKHLKSLPLTSFEIIICNNGSTDNTIFVAKKLSKNEEISCVSTPKRGFGIGLKEGITAASKEWITYVQADGEYDEDFISKALTLTDKFDFLVASKHFKKKHVGVNFFRNLLSEIFSLLVKVTMKSTDLGSSMMFRSSWAKQLINKFKKDNFSFQIELFYHALSTKQNIKEIPITPFVRKERVSYRVNIIKDGLSLMYNCIKYGIGWRLNRIFNR